MTRKGGGLLELRVEGYFYMFEARLIWIWGDGDKR